MPTKHSSMLPSMAPHWKHQKNMAGTDGANLKCVNPLIKTTHLKLGYNHYLLHLSDPVFIHHHHQQQMNLFYNQAAYRLLLFQHKAYIVYSNKVKREGEGRTVNCKLQQKNSSHSWYRWCRSVTVSVLKCLTAA